MNEDPIIQMARDAGFNTEHAATNECLRRFAGLVREDCAMILDANAKRCSHNSQAQMILYANATAIRARGQE